MDRPLWILIIKYLFFKLRIDVLFSPFLKHTERWALLVQFSLWRRKLPPIGLNDFFTFKENHKREKFYEFIVNQELQNDTEIDFLEFGVYNGESLQWWLKNVGSEKSRFYGFDSFEGLPENWGAVKKGTFSLEGKMPDMNDARCEFVKGWFQQTAHPFIDSHALNRKTIIHLDADLYSSTLYVLMAFSRKIKKGDIIIFDEFNSLAHEYKAFIDFTTSCYIDYEVIAAANNFTEVAIKIK